ncbi:SusC/RagA family TonB-linked outer membrane protein [Pedobacter sp. L105]|uniref:SusC/RagA family TonB-linked outer membrane protein n=1 Tax=Pedobacter sp. L105 TaxID=1641871 RepID=UPI00131BCCE9|nr:SusC/RagA family TonB-linked outer membrane protein [Pedobacter sp. L105]
MKRILQLTMCLLLFFGTSLYAQNTTLTGTVKGKDDGQPIPGVSVRVTGTTIGAVTGENGKFTIAVPSKNKTLTFTYIGYLPQEIPVSGMTSLNVLLIPDSHQLGEVVITGALGIKRQAKELGFAATNIDSKSLTESHPTNFTNGLTAKVAGLVVNTVNNGINPTTRFTLRGSRHITGNNYALVVLNGVPISPDAVNTISPDDIESVNVLNGAGAAALYGSEASNGALVITTKKGSGSVTPTITYSQNFQMENISYFPKLQHEFGSYGGESQSTYVDPVTGFITAPVVYENQSYGPAYTGAPTQLGIPLQDGTVQTVPYADQAKDQRKAFFQTGFAEQNNLSYASGDADNSFNLSANRLDRTGVVLNDKYNRTAIRVGGTKSSGIFKADFNAGFTQQNTSTYGHSYTSNSLDGGSTLYSTLLNTPSWVPLTSYKNINAPFSDVNTYYNSYAINPYWIVDNSRYNTVSNTFNGNINGTLTPTDWFNVSYRLSNNSGTANQQFTRSQVNYSAYAISDPTHEGGTIASSYGKSTVPGQVQNITQTGDGSISSLNADGSALAGPQGYARTQQDIVMNFHRTFFDDFKTNLLLGNTIWQENYKYIQNNSTSLLIDGFYNVGSIVGVPATSTQEGKIRQVDYYADGNIGYKDYAFLEGTLRNDHDSRLSAANRSFFYPSVKGSFIFTQAVSSLKDSKVISFGKLRASYSQVGSVTSSPYSINNTYTAAPGFPYGSSAALGLSTTLNNANLKPELSKELEFGADLGFFNNRINLSATYYNSHTTNQTIPISTSASTGYSTTLVNIGEVQNTGYEFKADFQVLPVTKNGVSLNLAGNLAIQDSKVISLTNGLSSVVLPGGYSNVYTAAVVGQSFPSLYGTDIIRDPQGRPVVDAKTGATTLNPSLVDLGRTTPKYIMGLTQTVNYKTVTLTLVEEYRGDYVEFNQGLQSATGDGVSDLSTQAGRSRFIFPNSVIQTSPGVYVPNTNVAVANGNLGFWTSGGYSLAASSYVSSGAFWKLREANLNFDLSSYIKKYKFIKRASFALFGRNLLMWRPKTNTWTDPEYSRTTGNSVGINDQDQLPPTRIFGANLNVTF